MRQWSQQQIEIFGHHERVEGHSAVIARAGTGKTTTICETARRIHEAHPSRRQLVLTFNVRNRQELEQRLAGTNTVAWTYNQLGFRFITAAWLGIRMDRDKPWRIARQAATQQGLMSKRKRDRPDREWVRRIHALTAMAKHTLPTNRDDLERLAVSMDLTDKTKYHPVILAEAVLKAMSMTLADTATYDFDDQIYLPVMYQLSPPYLFDNIFIDEAQDTDPAQCWLAQRVLHPNGQITIVGDDRQAIYEWRGAGERSMEYLIDWFHAKTYPLTVTYRCARRIVDEAKAIVSDIEARPDAPDGDVIANDIRYPHVVNLDTSSKTVRLEREAAELDVLNEVCRAARAGDAIISRTNKPLVSAALSVMRAGSAEVIILGRDPTELRGLIEDAQDNSAHVRSACRWIREKAKKDSDAFEEEGRFDLAENARDLAETASLIGDTVSTFEDWFAKIEQIFAKRDVDPETFTSKVVCSTVHRSKGFEWENVYLLGYTMKIGTVPEDNVRYVGITRAKNRLIWIGQPQPVKIINRDADKNTFEAGLMARPEGAR